MEAHKIGTALNLITRFILEVNLYLLYLDFSNVLRRKLTLIILENKTILRFEAYQPTAGLTFILHTKYMNEGSTGTRFTSDRQNYILLC